ncbi:hypothetical protein QFC22_004001 [Naganishia vaughanmartiniae]|uniref:Uncharacterized protein n=1 Tax=Naganishia vaughanmartiniae TaxID=1424756 RepID=A0ACC2X2I7_9TREE|nr:hypothetical protein QFC22_004001 [Naganishia vaughanmartiniae]
MSIMLDNISAYLVFFTSVWKSVVALQPPLHSSVPAGHPHTPFEQVWSGRHCVTKKSAKTDLDAWFYFSRTAVWHLPQFLGSVWKEDVATQTPPHSSLPSGQQHAPFEQVWSGRHCVTKKSAKTDLDAWFYFSRTAVWHLPQFLGSVWKEDVATQTPPHSSLPSGQQHAPFEQVWSGRHCVTKKSAKTDLDAWFYFSRTAVWHLPQFLGSVWKEDVATQTPPHSSLPSGQQHAPFEQVWSGRHCVTKKSAKTDLDAWFYFSRTAVWHLPQFLGSVWKEDVATQTPPHSSLPSGQQHAPFEQVWSGRHCVTKQLVTMSIMLDNISAYLVVAFTTVLHFFTSVWKSVVALQPPLHSSVPAGHPHTPFEQVWSGRHCVTKKSAKTDLDAWFYFSRTAVWHLPQFLGSVWKEDVATQTPPHSSLPSGQQHAPFEQVWSGRHCVTKQLVTMSIMLDNISAYLVVAFTTVLHFFTSVWKSVVALQPPLHSSVPAGHPHTPFEQVWSGRHCVTKKSAKTDLDAWFYFSRTAVWHLPQFLGSVWKEDVATQTPPHSSLPSGQQHAPFEQVWSGRHCVTKQLVTMSIMLDNISAYLVVAFTTVLHVGLEECCGFAATVALFRARWTSTYSV